jgi:UTP--glucose-1-phosphate uridylyltransferase
MRHFPGTQCFQKELLPLVDRDGTTRPAIQIVLHEALSSGIEEFCLVVSPERKEQFEQYFRGPDAGQLRYLAGKTWALEEGERLGALGERITYAVQEEPLGDGHSVYCAREFVGSEPFLLLLGDHVFVSRSDVPCSRQVIAAYERHQGPVSGVQRTREDALHQFGTLRGRPVEGDPGVYEVTFIHEKPTLEYAEEHLHTRGLARGEYLCFFGAHVMPPELMELLGHRVRLGLRERAGFQLTSGFEMLREVGLYLAVEVNGARYDMGMPFGLIQTQLALALHSPMQRQVMAWLPNLLTMAEPGVPH